MITPVADPSDTRPPKRNENIVRQEATRTTAERVTMDGGVIMLKNDNEHLTLAESIGKQESLA